MSVRGGEPGGLGVQDDLSHAATLGGLVGSRGRQPRVYRKHAIDRGVRERVTALVAGNAGMTAHPVPFDAVAGGLDVEQLPQITVLHWLAIGRLPGRAPSTAAAR